MPSAEKHSTVSKREERVRFSHYLQFYERLFEKVAKVFKYAEQTNSHNEKKIKFALTRFRFKVKKLTFRKVTQQR